MRRPASHGPDASTLALAAIVGHELNNIAVPLDGFVDLALQSMVLSAGDRQCIDEVRTGISRVRGLAALLLCLGQLESRPTRIPIADCMPAEVYGNLLDEGSFEWLCSAASAVMVDCLHAQRAVQSLARVAIGLPSGTPPRPLLTVLQGLPAGARCVLCGTAAARKVRHIVVRAASARPISAEALRDPFGYARAGGAVQRLSLATLLHSAHCAGGHIALDEKSGALCLAFPAA